MYKKEKVFQIIAKELIKKIKQGDFSSDGKLPSEMELAKVFGVSRATIREALSVLKAMGIISSQQGGGNYIEDVDSLDFLENVKIEKVDLEQMKHLFEVRFIFETQAAALAAKRRTAEDLLRLKKALQNLEESLSTDDEVGLEADVAFHREMIRATHNPLMINLMDHLSEFYHKVLKLTLEQNIGRKRKRQQVYKEHEAIYLAIEDGQPELAKVQCAIHLQNVQKKFSLHI